MKITLIGHSTVLLEANGLRLLTDPFFSNLMPAYGRLRKPDKSALAAGPVDAVLLSHGHFDHTDIPYLLRLGAETPVFCPRGYFGPGRSKRRLSPWETVEFKGLSLTAVPARHIGPSIGFVISDGDSTIYFAGDTLSSPFLAEIGGRFGLDAALMPVSGFRVRLVMSNRDAMKAAEMLRAPVVVPIHMDITPRLPFLRTRETPETYKALMAEVHPEVSVILLENGGSIVI